MFKKLTDWTNANRRRFGEIGVTFALIWLWVMAIMTVSAVLAAADILESNPYAALMDALLPRGMDQKASTSSVVGAYFWMFLSSVVLAPLVEEMFRAGLCQLCTDAAGRPRHVFALLSGSFLLFGLLHGQGYFSILIQGALGLLLTRLWFRTGPSKSWSYFSNVFVHAAYNFSVLTIQVLMITGS